MTLTELTNNIERFCENTEAQFIAAIPTFIRAAEERTLNTASIPAVRKTSTKTITSGTSYIGLPTDFISAFSLSVTPASGIASYLLNKDINFIRAAYPNTATLGVPQVYAQYDEDNILIGPSADASYSLELNYFAVPTSLVDQPAGTWLSQTYGTALLYGALINANVFMKGEADVQAQYENQFLAQFTSVDDLAKNKARKDAYRSGQQRTEGAV
jgi:hypothetical protein